MYIGSLQSEDLATWLSDFENTNKRKLRVLHIGNIASNGFLNAKFQRRLGIEADVLCHDYYDVMAYPEWEELEINNDYKQNILPHFSERDIGNYQRPRWFVQGPLSLCCAYLFARNNGQIELANDLWDQMNSFLFSEPLSEPTLDLPKFTSSFSNKMLFFEKKVKKIIQICYYFFKQIPGLANLFRSSHSIISSSYSSKTITNIEIDATTASASSLCLFVNQLNRQYALAFPDRRFHITTNELMPFYNQKEQWCSMFEHYDIIQCYATTPMYGLLFSNKPYIGFEHGTLRTFTSDDSFINALTALAYRQAGHVFITNGDCLGYAQKLGVKNYSPMIHPIDIEQHRLYDIKKISKIRSFYTCDILLFCPLRHDWDIKGTYLHIKALPLIIKQLKSYRVRLVLCNWGTQVEQSKELIKELKCENYVSWATPMCRQKMITYLQAADVVLDQIALPHFGSTAPQSLAAGTPVIMSYEPESTNWLVNEPAPILSAFDEYEIARQVVKALDRDWREEFRCIAKNWIDTHHSMDRLIQQQLNVYKNIMDGQSCLN